MDTFIVPGAYGMVAKSFDILIPLQATARRLGMQWLSPFVLHGVRDLTDEQLQDLARDYRRLLEPSSVPEHVS
ncbi:hypothetical protein FFF93_007290 [Arthrobacter sp. KBS0702]|uniref:NAD(P)H-dependent oxidoreductase n=1 Tax=Arthrobacter sp. KBS0702 TaxID=2578107 RepID=UPI00110EBD67|nr:NAD(P)H-dependent oxidoreductase [Arthrobacter sp. KBS0702]QDW29591.1 hypothetical protein FFF93_007290 [Arthrobacter sp. KBS0702]